MALVLDCSVTLAWSLPGELTEAVQRVLDVVMLDGAWVPGLWRLEVANGLQMSVRKGKFDNVFRDETLTDLGELSIQIDPHTDEYAWSTVLHLASQRRLTVYDAAYLELAIRRKLPLATLDKELRAAAEAEGIALLGI